jgi:superfamily II DNA/RNA helicase
VFNFDIPFHAEDYVHRIGRTGRAGQSGLAVNFVSKSDARLIAEIEKMLKSKIELEPLSFEEDLPDIRKQGHINDGRRLYREDGVRAGPSDEFERSPREAHRRAPRHVPLDPFFDKPYEPSLQPEAKPAWEAAPARSTARSSVSSNIKSKRNVAALFKAVAH